MCQVTSGERPKADRQEAQSLSECELSPWSGETQIKPIAFSIWMVLVCNGAAFIYVLAGGCSLDPRKPYYIITPMVIMTAVETGRHPHIFGLVLFSRDKRDLHFRVA